MKIPDWGDCSEQEARLGAHRWSVPRLIELSRNFPVMEVPLDHLNIYNTYAKLTLREMVMHIKATEKADLDCPIILDQDGDILDGRHRIMKALWLGKETIKAVRFDENPAPCRVTEADDE